MTTFASPLQNRVTPFGNIVAIPQRGTLMGNRGCLHDDQGVIRHYWKGQRWITCVLAHKSNQVPLRAPGRYTPLFFKDEVSALAAGHRPCAKCRRSAYRNFVSAIEKSYRLNPGSLRADDIDAMLHKQRVRSVQERPRLRPDTARRLPVGTMLCFEETPLVVLPGGIECWDWVVRREYKPTTSLILLTPPLILAALTHGYQPLEARAL